jgi:hypothetical protein
MFVDTPVPVCAVARLTDWPAPAVVSVAIDQRLPGEATGAGGEPAPVTRVRNRGTSA